MNFLINTLNLVNDHGFITFVVIVAIGMVWIYFQVPNIKAKTASPNSVVSSREDWTQARKSTDKYTFVVSSIGAAFAYAIWVYTPDGKNDPLVTFFNGMAAICFLTAFGMQLMNRKLSNMYINNKE